MSDICHSWKSIGRGDRFTIADITLHVTLGFGRLVKFKPWEEHVNFAAWRERMTARPGLK